MAPLRTPKNKKQTHDVSTPTDTPTGDDEMGPTSPFRESRPPMVSQTSETYEKAQEDEREVLKAVFMDDYEESEAKGAWSVRYRVSTLPRHIILTYNDSVSVQAKR
jgi:translation initiation factor 2-alpha kinase 4